MRQEFKLELRKRLHCLIDNSDEQATADLKEGKETMQSNLEQKWEGSGAVFNETAKRTLRYKKKYGKSWITVNSWKKIEDRRANKKRKVNDAKSSKQKAQEKAEYQRLNKEVKSSFRDDNREWANIAQEAEEARTN